MPITDMTACELAAALTEKRLSSREATAAYLDRIAALDKEINSYITVTPEQAMKDAEASDARRAKGETLSPLDGVPMALKDVICSKGVRTTAASKILYNFVPPYDATCWSRLKAGGAVLLGKVNMDEFAMGSSTETSAFGPTRNPWDEERVPGGSSGGSAAAVAAGLAVYSLGTDTGGSVRQPAHFCGVVGLKPTYGRVSRYGVIPYASSLDQVGVLARDCRDAASVLQLIAGQDRMDSTSAPAPVEDYASACGEDITGLKIGLPKEFMSDAIAPDIAFAMRQGAERLAPWWRK